MREIEIFKVSKQSIEKKVTESGILSKQLEMQYIYQMIVENPFQERTIPLIIHDRIPKPQIIGAGGQNNLNVNIDYTKISSKPHRVYKSGLVRWELELSPREEQQVDFNIFLVRGE